MSVDPHGDATVLRRLLITVLALAAVAAVVGSAAFVGIGDSTAASSEPAGLASAADPGCASPCPAGLAGSVADLTGRTLEEDWAALAAVPSVPAPDPAPVSGSSPSSADDQRKPDRRAADNSGKKDKGSDHSGDGGQRGHSGGSDS